MTDGLAGVDWVPAAHLRVAIDDDGKRHAVQTLRQGRPTSTRVVEVTMRRCNAPFDAAGAGNRLLTGASRRGAGLQQPGQRLGAARCRADRVGSLRRAGVFAAVLGDAVGESGRVLTIDTSREASRAARVGWSTCRTRRSSPIRCGGPWRRNGPAPMWLCWIRRDRALGARSSIEWWPPRFHGWCTSVERQHLRPRRRSLSQSWLRGRTRSGGSTRSR
jgi:hypothetical protein